ncbi:MAG: GatB/YqeY domain-containing protein [Chloroflexota bacterium]
MTTKADLELALKDALRSGDSVRKGTIRMVIAAIKLAEAEKKGTILDENAVHAVIQKEIKARREAIADAERLNRDDLIAEAGAEIAVLESFLPRQLSSEELEALAREVIAEVGATSPKEMGLVMKALMPRVQERAAGNRVSQTVQKLLSA